MCLSAPPPPLVVLDLRGRGTELDRRQFGGCPKTCSRAVSPMSALGWWSEALHRPKTRSRGGLGHVGARVVVEEALHRPNAPSRGGPAHRRESGTAYRRSPKPAAVSPS